MGLTTGGGSSAIGEGDEFGGEGYGEREEGYGESFGDIGDYADGENEICEPPNAVKECLEEIFQQSIAEIKVVPYQSEPAYFIGEYSAWTGPNTINLVERDYPTCESFWEDDLELTIHEYYHVVEQWNKGMTAVEYGVLSYFKEKDAKEFARGHVQQYRDCLDGEK